MPFIAQPRSIIPACDVGTLDELVALVQATADLDGIGAYKIDGPGSCVLRVGLDAAVAAVRDLTDKPLIYDHQKAGTDIPDLGTMFGNNVKEVAAAILFPFTGPETEEAWIKAVQDVGVVPIVGAEMTHKRFRASEGGYINDEAFDRMLTLAAELGVRDFVVPGNKPDRVEYYHELLTSLCCDPIAFYAPGFVAQGGVISDAGKAAGEIFHAIVGRGIYAADDMRAAAMEHCSAIA